MGTLDHNRVSLIIYPRHSLILFKLLCSQKFSKLLLSGGLFICFFAFDKLHLVLRYKFLCLWWIYRKANSASACLFWITSVTSEQLAWCIERCRFWISLWTFYYLFSRSFVLLFNLRFAEVLLIWFSISMRRLCLYLYFSLVDYSVLRTFAWHCLIVRDRCCLLFLRFFYIAFIHF